MAIVKVPVTKGKGFIELDTETLPDTVYQEALMQGLKVLANRGMTKITKELYPNAAELAAAAMAKAEATKADMLAGKIRIMGAKASDGKVSGAVMTEARRLARNLIKDQIKRDGGKISHYDAKDITAAANALIAANPEVVEQAKASIAARDAEASQIATTLGEVAKSISASPKKIKAAEDAKANKPLSAAKAGKVKVRQKPEAATATMQ